MPDSVVATLTGHGHREITPVTVMIGRATYEGASYSERETGEKRYYLLGECPPSSRRRTVYRFPEDEGDWYVACSMEQARINASNRQYHPHGAWFGLHRWPHEQFGERVDRYDDSARKRMNIKEAVHA